MGIGIKKNDSGVILTGNVQLYNPVFGTGAYKNGYPVVDWKKWETDYSDNNGFDTNNKEENGEYIIRVNLPKGTQLIRYGREIGKFTAPKGTPYEQLSLPYNKDTVEYHEYRVIADNVSVYCIVHKGKVAPKFGFPGGGIQYFHIDENMRSLMEKKIIEEVYL